MTEEIDEKKLIIDFDSIDEGLKKQEKDEIVLKSENEGLYFAMASNKLTPYELANLGLAVMDKLRSPTPDNQSKKSMPGVN